MSRFAILAITLTLAIIFVGAILGWYVYNTLFDSTENFIRVEPQQASSVEIIQKTERKAPTNNAFEELLE